MLEINRDELQIPGVTLFDMAGRVDSSNAQGINETITSGIENTPVIIIISLQNLDFMTSAGFRELLTLRKECLKNGCSLKLVLDMANKGNRMVELVDMGGFDAVFEIYATKLKAVESLNLNL